MVEVLVPVQSCPKYTKVNRPSMPYWYVNTTTKPAEIARAYKQTVIILQTYSAKLEEELNLYE